MVFCSFKIILNYAKKKFNTEHSSLVLRVFMLNPWKGDKKGRSGSK